MKQRFQTWRNFLVAHPLLAAMVVGELARMLTAVFSPGFHARDDYFHVLEPALRWAEDPNFDWDTSDVPGAGIRSHLVPRVVWLIVVAAKHMGITEPESLLSLVYAVIGTYSVLVIPAMYLLCSRLLDKKSAQLATWLAAIHFAMPYAGTRLLIEAMAMPPLVFGLWFATYKKFWRVSLAGFFIGLACWFRFQVGAAAMGVAIVLGWQAFKKQNVLYASRAVGALALGGALSLSLQGLFDLATAGDFLGPMIRNIALNLDPHPELSRTTPFAYLGTWLLLTVPPATIVLVPLLFKAGKQLTLVSVPFLVFVLIHSLIPHKEERFMLPVLPLFLVLLAAVPMALTDAKGTFWGAIKKIWPATAIFLCVTHVVALLVVMTSQSQQNLREAMLELRKDHEVRAVISLGPEMQTFFLGDTKFPIRRNSQLDAGWVAKTSDNLEQQGHLANRFLGFLVDRAKIQILLEALGYVCEPPEQLDGYWLDRLVFYFNPKRNKRRSPVLIWSCENIGLAKTLPTQQEFFAHQTP